MTYRILLVDDDPAIRDNVGTYLQSKAYEVFTADNAEKGLEMLTKTLPDVTLVDVKMPDKDGLWLLEEARTLCIPTVFLMISAYADIDRAVKATKLGASYVLQKPFSPDQLEEAIKKHIGTAGTSPRPLLSDDRPLMVIKDNWSLVGASEAIREIYQKVLKVALAPQATVLIQGESGTGKEMVARAIYDNTPGEKGDFVDVNCAALSESLLEAELFGYEKGAFTGAIRTHAGLFETAHGGAIFLDEIGEMPLNLQTKLLRVLEQKAFKRVGGVKNIRVDTRVIASTNRDLRRMVGEGTFREDLYWRLNVICIHIPPLRERPEDVPVLADFFARRLSGIYNGGAVTISSAAMDKLSAHTWPGNVRELRNVIERAVIMSNGTEIRPEDIEITPPVGEPAAEATTDAAGLIRLQSIEEMEKALIAHVLKETGGRKAQAARILGINRTTLWHKMRKYGIEG